MAFHGITLDIHAIVESESFAGEICLRTRPVGVALFTRFPWKRRGWRNHTGVQCRFRAGKRLSLFLPARPFLAGCTSIAMFFNRVWSESGESELGSGADGVQQSDTLLHREELCFRSVDHMLPPVHVRWAPCSCGAVGVSGPSSMVRLLVLPDCGTIWEGRGGGASGWML